VPKYPKQNLVLMVLLSKQLVALSPFTLLATIATIISKTLFIDIH
jgi:hypothetical protein